ncbi:hypothetical protein BDV25DRAFT_142715 [Aspergillus avenaceus]|uniref:Uncharacterized protein n=1 Tax=Aspergillus avenaceus TaxID=36643 RepID=A0A5N6TM88_ASPAV|nr:hypothetical protein BDV25DRAFT_142715 [Aspergillus avenaceus]
MNKELLNNDNPPLQDKGQSIKEVYPDLYYEDDSKLNQPTKVRFFIDVPRKATNFEILTQSISTFSDMKEKGLLCNPASPVEKGLKRISYHILAGCHHGGLLLVDNFINVLIRSRKHVGKCKDDELPLPLRSGDGKVRALMSEITWEKKGEEVVISDVDADDVDYMGYMDEMGGMGDMVDMNCIDDKNDMGGTRDMGDMRETDVRDALELTGGVEAKPWSPLD